MKQYFNNLTGKLLVKVFILLQLTVYVILVACSNDKKVIKPLSQEYKVGDLKEQILSDSGATSPEIILAGNPIVTPVRPKKSLKEKKDVEYSLGQRLLKIKYPEKIYPGCNNIPAPDTISVITSKTLCKEPEILQAKDAYSKEINPLNFSSYSKLQGLRHDQVRSMALDKAGNLWLATDDGLTKFDGKYFSHYTIDQGLNNNLILSVLADSKGNIWFGSFGGGAIKFDGKYLYTFTDSNGLINNVVNTIYEDRDGNIWFGTAGGISLYNGEEIINYTPENGLIHNYIRSIIQDNSGKMWISTNNAGISIYDGESFTNLSEKEGLPKNNIISLFKDHAGNIWLGSTRYTLVSFDGHNFTEYPLARKHESGDELIRTIIEDEEGTLWLGTEQSGLSQFNGKYFIHYNEKDGLPSNMIRSSLIDPDGNIWFGTRGAGFARFDGKLFTHLTVNEGISNNRVMSFLEYENGDLWLGTYGGYVTRISTRIENGISVRYFSYYDNNDGIRNGRIYDIQKDRNGRIWFGTDGGGVSVFDGTNIKTYTHLQGLCSDSIRKIEADRKGNLWFASYGSGLSKFDGKYFYNYSKKQGLSSNDLLTLMEDRDGRIWIGTVNAGVSVYEAGKFTNYSTIQGFPNNTVYSLMQDKKGVIWLGTGGSGVITYDGKYFQSFPQSNPLNGKYILSLLQDSYGNIWLGTRFGIAVLDTEAGDKPELYDADAFLRTFTYEDGFSGIGCNVGAITESGKGDILIGTNDRLTTYHREGDKKYSGPLKIEIMGIKLFNERVPWSRILGKKDTVITLNNGVNLSGIKFSGISEWNNIPINLSLRHNNNYVTFSYIAASLKNSSKIRYQYKLDGFEENWNSPTESTEVSFGNLKNGNYNFRLKAIDSNGRWSDEVSYQFVIRPPWYKTIFFRIFTLAAILVVIYYYIRYRINRLEKDKEKLQVKVDNQTSEITGKNLVLTQQKNEILEKNLAIEKTNQELIRINNEKDKFFSIIAHDLRGPFSGLMMLTEEMNAQIDELDKEEIKDMLKAMQVSSANLFRLLENLLNWSRVQRGKMPFDPENLNLLQVINESLALLLDQAGTKKIEIRINVPPEIEVFADKNMLQTILRNLVSNAIKFTYAGGIVTLNAYTGNTEEVIVSVKDTGIGMSSEMTSRIFHIDEKISRKGTEGETSTGLGLLLCNEFIEKHKGRIWVESSEGKGSQFMFSLPVEPK